MRALLLTMPALAALTSGIPASTAATPSGVLPDTGDRPRLIVVDGKLVAGATDSLLPHGALACPMPVHVPFPAIVLPDTMPGRLSIRTRPLSPPNVSRMPIARSGCLNPLYSPVAPAPPDTPAQRQP